MTRAERAEQAARLHAEGLDSYEVARRMGIGYSYARELLNDPDGAKVKARKRRNGGTCTVCGGPTDGSNGKAKAPKRCAKCEWARHKDRNERVFEAWERGETAKQIAAREGMTDTAVDSLIDHHRGRNGRWISVHRRPSRSLWPIIAKRYGEGASYAEIAAEWDTTPQNISMMVRQMRRAGFDLPRRRAA